MGADAAIWYEFIKSIQKPELAALMGSSPKFEDDRYVLPLQAADMLAWHIRRHKDRPDEDEGSWPTEPVTDLLHAEIHLTKEVLITIAEKMSKVPGLELVQKKTKGRDTLRAAIEQTIRARFPKSRPGGE